MSEEVTGSTKWDEKSKTALIKKGEGTPINEAVEAALIEGNMAKLEVRDRVIYYKRTCESLGLNPLTKPFDYLVLNNKLVLYANKNCTEQLRAIHKVSIVELKATEVAGILTVVAKAQHGDGRTDVSTGAVSFGHLKGNERANAIMKAETKAKRRVTLALCGLGMLDETEVDTIRGARTVSEDWDPGLKPPAIEVERRREPEETATSEAEAPQTHPAIESIRQVEQEERARLISDIQAIKEGWDPESWEGFKVKTLGVKNGNRMTLDQLRTLKKALDDLGPPALPADKDGGDSPKGSHFLNEERNRVGWDGFNKAFFKLFKSKGPDDLNDEDVARLLTELRLLPDSLARGHKVGARA